MREIEFRGKRIYNGKWVYGNLIFTSNGAPHIFTVAETEEDGHHVRFDTDSPSWVDHRTVGQYTGLKDKNGVKIFEGDIVSFWDGTVHKCSDGDIVINGQKFKQNENIKRPVVFVDGCFRFGSVGLLMIFDVGRENELTIIGNIHDNPELVNRE